jgi:multisubunit Na+/H+ antiporter MnhC subunit
MRTEPVSTPVEPSRVEDPAPSRRVAGFLVLAGLWPLLVWPNFARVVATDERAWDDGPTAYLLVHVALAVTSMAIGLALVVVGVRAWRRSGARTL